MMSRTEKLNLGINIVGGIFGVLIIPGLICWAVWTVNAKFDHERASEDAYNSEHYVSKPWYQSNRDETNKRLDVISDDLSKIKEKVAEINGRIETTVRTTR